MTGAAFIVVLARRPEQLFDARFYGEDGSVFYVGTYFGSVPEVLFRSYAGYANLLTRLIAYVERAVPVLWAPLIANFFAILVVSLFAGFLASGRLSRVAPHPGMRLGIATLLLVLPNSAQTLGIAADMMRYVPLFLLALVLATAPVSLFGRIVDFAVVGVATVTGPGGIVMLPLFWWRSWREKEPHFVRLTAVMTVGVAVQIIAILMSSRHAANLSGPLDLVRAFTFRTTVQSILGEQITYLLSASGFPIAIGAVAAIGTGVALLWIWSRALPGNVKWPVMWTLLSLTVASALAQTEGGTILDTIGAAERYFVHSTALTAVVIVVGFVLLRRGPQRVVATALMVMLCIGIGADLRMFPFPRYNWAGTSSCIGGKAACVVDVFPAPLWSIHWPGIHGSYVQPHPNA